MKVVTSSSSKKTRELGKKIGQQLPDQAVLALFGKLGSGKTEFVKGLAQGLGIKRTITSPSYILLNHYYFQKHKTRHILYHLDLYRLNNITKDILSLGREELFTQPNRIVVIEWPEKIKKFLPRNHWSIYFSYGEKEHIRKIKFSRPFS